LISSKDSDELLRFFAAHLFVGRQAQNSLVRHENHKDGNSDSFNQAFHDCPLEALNKKKNLFLSYHLRRQVSPRENAAKQLGHLERSTAESIDLVNKR
jgi:hypothetical protein